MKMIAALDIGTTTARAAVFDDSGERVGFARSTLRSQHPFVGAVEQDPLEIVDTAIDVLQKCLQDAAVKAADIESLGITNQRASVVAWDSATKQPLCPLISWQDTRTTDRVAEFVSAGIPLNTSASCSKLEWLMANDELVSDASSQGTLRFGTVDSWLTWALSAGSVHATDPSNAAATGLYDLFAGDWSDDVLAVFGLAREAMATVVASDSVVGHCDPALVGAPIALAARCGDQMAACLAHGMVEGTAKLSLGTSAMLDVGTGSKVAEAPAGCYALPLWRRSIDGTVVDEFCVEGSVLSAGSVIEWLVRIGLLDRVEQLDTVASTGSPNAEFVTSLAGRGSHRTDPQARGIISGIGMNTTAADIVLAAIHGIANEVAGLTSHMAEAGLALSEPLLVDGGLSQSQLLLRAIQETTGLKISPATDHETAVQGAALLAMS